MSEGDPLLPEVASQEPSSLPRRTSRSSDRGIFDDLRKKLIFAAGVGLTSGALGGAFGTQGCLPAESETDQHGQNEKVGKAQQAVWQDPPSDPSWGQDSAGNNGSPFVYWKDANNGIAVFASNKPGGLGGHDIYISTTSTGPDGPWTPEVPIDDSLSVIKVNTLGEQAGAAICVGGNCGTGKFFVASSSDIYEGDFNLSTYQVSNLVKLPSGPSKVNTVGGELYPSVDAAGTKLYWSSTTKVFVSNIELDPTDGSGTKWNRAEITGFIGATNGTPAVWSSHIMVSTPDGCENVGGSGDNDLCQYDLAGSTVSNHYNANVVPGSLAIPNTAQDQVTPMVDSKGILWYASRESGPQAKIKRKDPKVGMGGTGGAGGSGGSGTGSTGGAGGAGGSGGSGTGSTGGAGGAGGSETGGTGGAGGSETGGTGGAGGAMPIDCAIKVESGPGVVTCDASGSFITMKITAEDQEVKFVGPKDGCYVIATKLPSAEGDSITYNGALDFPVGVDHHVKNINHCYSKGTIAGLGAFYEGTEPIVRYTPEYNKDRLHVITIALPEGQIRYEHNGKPIQSISFPEEKCMNDKPCEPGQQPQNTEISLDLDVYQSVDPGELPITKPKPPEGCGCDVPGTQSDTHSGVLAVLAAGIAFARRRRKE